jgi:hypothetical protein
VGPSRPGDRAKKAIQYRASGSRRGSTNTRRGSAETVRRNSTETAWTPSSHIVGVGGASVGGSEYMGEGDVNSNFKFVLGELLFNVDTSIGEL